MIDHIHNKVKNTIANRPSSVVSASAVTDCFSGWLMMPQPLDLHKLQRVGLPVAS